MSLYRLEDKNLQLIKEKSFPLERDLQRVVETNLNKLFGLTFITTEFQLKNLRIDTLAFDDELKSFVIIEYKRNSSFSVVDQGFSYLSILLNNKADFILEYSEKTKKPLSRGEIDWSQSKVIFIAESFTAYQKEAINFKDLPIELWEARKYENNLFSLNQIQAANKTESIKTISKDKKIEEVSKEIKQYTIDDHFRKDWDTIREIFDILTERVLNLDSRIAIKSLSGYIGFQIGGFNVLLTRVRSDKLIVEIIRIRPQDLLDPGHKLKYIDKSFDHYRTHISKMEVKNETDIDYVIMLIKQVLKKFF